MLTAYYTPPALISTLWAELEAAGITSGHGLEPGCGAGTFISMAPQSVTMTGVEIDPTSAEVARRLNPNDTIRTEGYQNTPTERLYDFTVGNVPFGDLTLHDPVHNPGQHRIHNHFILKALGQTKPGGYVTVLTSHFTLDSRNPAARRDMQAIADLVSAVRLPSQVFAASTGTQVVTDLLVFRVRKDSESPAPFDWEYSHLQDLPTKNHTSAPEQIALNDVFAPGHRGRTLGDMQAAQGLYGAWGIQVQGNGPDELAPILAQALRADLRQAAQLGLSHSPTDEPVTIQGTVTLEQPIGTIRAEGDEFYILGHDGWQPLKVPKTQRAQTNALLDLRDRTRSLLDVERSTRGDSPSLEAQRRDLREAWTRYTQAYGPLNQATRVVRAGVDKATGEPTEIISWRRPPVMTRFSKDPFSALTRAIEVYDEHSGDLSPAPILTSRQIFAAYTPKGAETPADALAISMDQLGRIDLEYCAYLLGAASQTEARQAIGDLAFDLPEGGMSVREEYLSGNVRQKLKAAQEASQDDPQFTTNVQALTEVLPRPLGVADVVPTVGATWIEPGDYEAFLRETISGYPRVSFNPAEGWKVEGCAHGVAATSTYGSKKMPAGQIFQDMLNAKPIKVTFTDDQGKTCIDVKATEAAKGHAERLNDSFAAWIFTDPQRTRRILRTYNERFNSLVPRTYDAAGQRLTLPGLALRYKLHPHQRSAIARMIAEPNTGLFHEVGAGKTLEMVCGVMEQKRLGLVKKPMIVVPNHMLVQFEREWLDAYPTARILTADTDRLGKADRADFMARATTGDWDAIICTQGAFRKLPVRPETVDAYEARSLKALEAWMAESNDSYSVRRAELKRQRLQEKLAREADARARTTDSGVTFEDLGVDYLVVDEAHSYKNLSTHTNTTGILVSDSAGKCKDLDMKLGYLRSRHDRVATFATATPVANTMGELWVMTHYLRPDVLHHAGLDTFDTWAQTFTGLETRVEANAAGTLKVRQRIARFQNLPELQTMLRTFADVKRRDELGLKLPDLAKDQDGRRRAQTITVNIGQAMAEFNEALVKRAERIETKQVEAWEDNYLAITSDARALATDHRLLKDKSRQRALEHVTSPIDTQKVDAAANNIANIYHNTRHLAYTDDDHNLSPTKGALQIVFADQGTPKKGQWNLYGELKTQLMERGVPSEQIVFIHDAANSVEKDRIFAQARSGSIAVLIGSTEKMGTGANMQKRAIALHHITCPWRPCDITQREGRIIRQGNENPEVQIYRYATEGSFDTVLWQGLERKAAFIDQVMSSSLTERSVDAVDLSQDEADFAQVKTLASGNPLQMEEARLKNEVTKFQRRSDQWKHEQAYLAKLGPLLDSQYKTYTQRAAKYDDLAQTVAQNAGSFSMTLNSVTVTDRKQAAAMLRSRMSSLAKFTDGYRTWDDRTTWISTGAKLTVNDIDLEIGLVPQWSNSHDRSHRWIISAIALHNDPTYLGHHGAVITGEDIQAEGIGNIRRIENHLNSLTTLGETLHAAAENNRAERAQVDTNLGEDNPWISQLNEAKQSLRSVRAALSGSSDNEPTQTSLDVGSRLQNISDNLRATAPTHLSHTPHHQPRQSPTAPRTQPPRSAPRL